MNRKPIKVSIKNHYYLIREKMQILFHFLLFTMNSSTYYTLNIVIDSSINICLSTSLFIFIIYHVIKTKNSPNRVALYLTANMYLALVFSAISILEQYTHVLSKHLYTMIPPSNGITCQIAAYFQWVSVCAVYYSNSLQAVYRLCRVVFHQKQSLQSYKLYLILTIIQWIFCFVIMIPTLLLGYYRYVPDDNICSHEITILQSAVLTSFLAYIIPVSITTGCYVYTLKKMRRGNNSLLHTMTQIQQKSARRDLVVLLRICILLAILLTIWIPIAIGFLFYVRSGVKPWWLGQIQRLIFHLSTASVSVSLLMISPHIWNLWKRNTVRQHPSVVTPANIRIN